MTWDAKKRTLPAAICWATENEAVSRAVVETNGADEEKVARDFDAAFAKRWKEAEAAAIEASGVKDFEKGDGRFPSIDAGWRPDKAPERIEGGLSWRFEPLAIDYPWDKVEVAAPCEAVAKALSDVEAANPGIGWSAAFSFPWSDGRGGGEEDFAISSALGTRTDPAKLVWAAAGEAFARGGDATERLAREVESLDPDDVEATFDAFDEAERAGFVPKGTAAKAAADVEALMREDGVFDDPRDEGAAAFLALARARYGAGGGR